MVDSTIDGCSAEVPASCHQDEPRTTLVTGGGIRRRARVPRRGQFVRLAKACRARTAQALHAFYCVSSQGGGKSADIGLVAPIRTYRSVRCAVHSTTRGYRRSSQAITLLDAPALRTGCSSPEGTPWSIGSGCTRSIALACLPGKQLCQMARVRAIGTCSAYPRGASSHRAGFAGRRDRVRSRRRWPGNYPCRSQCMSKYRACFTCVPRLRIEPHRLRNFIGGKS